MAASTPSRPIQRFGGFEVDPRSRELRREGMRIRLQDQPLEVLLMLLDRKGDVVTREELKQQLWPAGTFVDADDGLNTAVRKLREALGDSTDQPAYIETIPRRGYRFVGAIEDEPIPSPASAEPRAEAHWPTNPPAPAVIAESRIHWSWVTGIAILLAVLALSTWAILRSRPISPSNYPAITSLAVLPLQNLSGDPAQDYFADGITEELIGRLSTIRGLRVISRTSSMQFKNTHMSAPEIAKALNVDALVEGSVIREGGRVRVHAQLIRAASDEHFWSEAYDREMEHALALESDIAQAIARKVEVTVTGDERSRLVAARPVSPDVYENYLKGRRLTEGNSKAEIEQGIAYLEEAVRKDATFAPAYVGLADAYTVLGTEFIGMPAVETRSKVIDAAQKAIELDPSLAEAHVSLASAYRRQWRWSDAEAEYKRALQLNPNNSVAHREYGAWLLCQDRIEEALSWARRGRELDPLGTTGVDIGWILFLARRYDEAIREFRGAVAVQPDVAFANWCLGFALIYNGKPQEAIPPLEKAVALTNRSPGTLALLANAYARAGRRTDVVHIIDELKHHRETGYVPAGAFVFTSMALGDRDQTFFWLEGAFHEQSNMFQFLRVHPFFDPLRDDPRFADLLRRVGLDKSHQQP